MTSLSSAITSPGARNERPYRPRQPAQRQRHHRDAQYFEYTKVANPIGAKLISRIPFQTFPASLYADGPTRVVALDLSQELACPSPATGPGLLASFVRILKGEDIRIDPLAPS